MKNQLLNKNIFKVFSVLILFASIFYIATSPIVSYSIGNIFFGEVPSLYNVNLAQKFYKNAAYPIWGSTPEFAHYQLSRTYFITGFFKRSIEEAQKELLLYPDNARTYYIIGLTYGYMGKEEDAIEAFSKFIEEYPMSWAARNDKAWLQFRIGDIEGALTTIAPVSENLNPWVQNTYGVILLNLGREEEARQAFINAGNNVELMSVGDWGAAYPGNDPRIYQSGLDAMKNSANSNLQLLDSGI